MGGIWLHDLPDVVARAGLNYGLWPGWETRSRSSGGYDAVWGIGTHHDAGAPSQSLNSRCSYAWDNADDRPIGALWLHSDGFVMIGAAGATNTQGKGGPRLTTKGTIPLDAGNRYTFSIEASNDGVGQPWPTVQQDAYVKLVVALCQRFGLTPGDVFAHFEWTNRKIDPAGNSRYAQGGNSWNMDQFRSDVFTKLYPPPDPVNPLPGGSDVFHPVQPYRNSDTRQLGGVVKANTQMRFSLNDQVIPANAVAVAMNVTVVSANAPGFLTVWPDQGSMPNVSACNFPRSEAATSGVVVGVINRFFRVQVNVPCHIICDVTGYWTP